MPEKEFNLLYEPWILVMRPDGKIEEVSILDAFRRAPEFRSLAGELPTQDVAVMRLLLAILHVVFARYDEKGNPKPMQSPDEVLDRWEALWNMKDFPMKVIEEYLDQYEDLFYLFHPERPFYQVAALRNREDCFGPFDVSKLIGELAESDHKLRLFAPRLGESKKALQYAEAARWLLYMNAFAETFGKLESKGKPTEAATTLGVGWLGKLGLIFAIGENLFETLTLNLVLLMDGEKVWGDEKPIWENKSPITDERHEITIPENPSELLTLQSRRLLLLRENGRVQKYIFLSGDFFIKENSFPEQMTIWTYRTEKGKMPGKYFPRQHEPTRHIWRDFPAIVMQTEGKHRPGIISWLAKLREENIIPRSQINFQITAVSYGNMQAVIDDTFSDSISFNAKLLTSLGEDWVNKIVSELETTDLLVKELGFLAENLAKAAGFSDNEKKKDYAKELAYFVLDEPFRRWLEGIDPEKDEDAKDEKCELWWKEAQRVVRKLGRELIEQTDPQAFVGREVTEKMKGKNVKRLYTSPGVYNVFLLRTDSKQSLRGGEDHE